VDEIELDDELRGPFRLLYQEDDGTWNAAKTLQDVDDIGIGYAHAQALANQLGRRVELCSLDTSPEMIFFGAREPSRPG
jgi:hypothetical protein